MALAGMWAYAANDSVEKGLRLGAEAKAGSSAGHSVHTLVTRLQDERRRTAAWQSHRTKNAHAALEAARARTDKALTAFRAAEGRFDDLGQSVDTDKQRTLTKSLGDLTRERNQVDSRASGRGDSYRYYTGAAEAGTIFLADVLHSDDGQLAHSAAAVTSLVQIGELLSREDALLTGAEPSGQMSTTVRQTFLGHVAAQRQAARNMDTRNIPASAAGDYRRIADQRQWAVVQRIEDSIGSQARQAPSRSTTPGSGTTTPGTTTPGTTPTTPRSAPARWELPARASEWRDAADAVTGDLRDAASASLDGMAGQGAARADDALLTAGAGSAAVLAVLALTGFLAVRLSRSLTRRLAGLEEATVQWTDTSLPDLVARYKQGERSGGLPTVPHESGAAAHDELGRLVSAVREQQRSAVEELSGLAEAIDAKWKSDAETTQQQHRKREGAETVVLGLLRRNQLLISQLISLIDSLERREHDPELLTDIFKIDHLVTRLRRDLENQSLIVGVQPGRRWSKPVPVFQVLRSAVAETVDYTRVEVETAPEFSLSGRVVADVGHILAALIENGTSFSPPHTHVNVRAEEVAGGRLAVEVIDRGLGMDTEQYEHLNRLLADPPEPDVTRLGEIPQLGLFVVALLANRIGLEITLCRSAYGGTKAVVLIPNELLEEAPPILPAFREPADEDGGRQDDAVRGEFAEHAAVPAADAVRPKRREPSAAERTAERDGYQRDGLERDGYERDGYERETPQRRAPGRELSERPLPDRSAPEPRTPERPATGHPEPERLAAPRRDLPTRTAPERGLPQRGAPEREPAKRSEPRRQPAHASAPVLTPDVGGACSGLQPDPEDDLGGYPAYTGGGLQTRPEPESAEQLDAAALTALMSPRAEAESAAAEASAAPEAPAAPTAPTAPAAPAAAATYEAQAPTAPATPEPWTAASTTASAPPSVPPQAPPERSEPGRLKAPLTLPTRKPGENLAAPLRRPPGPPPTAERHSADDGHAPRWPTPGRAGAIAGAVQRAGRQARTESSDAQCDGVSPEDA